MLCYLGNTVPLGKAIVDDTSGDFRNLLVDLTMGNRNNETEVNEKRTKTLINNISAFLDYRMDSDGSVVSTILVRESYAQLKDVISKYPKMTGQTLQAALKNYYDGDYLDAVLAIGGFTIQTLLVPKQSLVWRLKLSLHLLVF